MTPRNLLPGLKALVIVAVALSGVLAHAQQPPPAGDDPPVRVGRMSYVSGDVSFSPAGNDEWVHARVNRPIVTGDQLWSDNNGRAEITIDNSAWWVGEYTSLTVSNLDDRIAQIQLQQGTLDFRVRRMPSGQIVEVDTPNLAFTVTRPGRYRLVVDPQGDSTTVIVRAGAGDVYGENASYALASGQAYRFYGTDLSDSEYLEMPQPDAFDRWAVERDRRYDQVVSARYVSPEVIGYEDLDTYGSWSVQASYGNVWFPRQVAAGWVPYRDGHWVWIDPWGWTWVDDAPWGFAPFHYGRWAWFDSGWGWIPGPRAVRPVYAPALVAFIGGAGFSITVSSGPAIGWFPLGPREVYRPPYYVSRDYFRQVNVSNTVINQVNITNVYNNYRSNTNVTQVNYVNMRAPNAVTAVAPAVFAQSQNVRRAAVPVSASTLSRAQVQPVARVAPARAAFLGAAPVAQAKPPAAVVDRAVVARRAPPPAPVRDTAKLQALEQNPGRPLTQRQVQQLRATAPAAAAATPRPVRVVEQPKPAANAAPPARSASERAAQRAQGGPREPASTPGTSAPGTAERAVAPPAGASPAEPPSRGAAAAREGAPRGAQPEQKGPAAAERPPQVGESRRPEPRAAPPGPQPQRPDAGPPGADRATGERPAPQARPQPQERAQPQARSQPQERPQPQDRPQPQARPEPQERAQPQARPEPQERAQPQARPEPRERPQQQARPESQERAQPQARPQPQERPQPQARPEPQERAQQQARPQPQERPQPQARPQPQERPQPQARPEPQERAQQQARPQPQERPQPQARPQPQERPQPQARPQPQERPQPQAKPQPQERPQPQARGKGSDKDKDKDKDNN